MSDSNHQYDSSQYSVVRVVTRAGVENHPVPPGGRLAAAPSRTGRWLYVTDRGHRIASHRMREVVSYYSVVRSAL